MDLVVYPSAFSTWVTFADLIEGSRSGIRDAELDSIADVAPLEEPPKSQKEERGQSAPPADGRGGFARHGQSEVFRSD
jgi:hypothetical protein